MKLSSINTLKASNFMVKRSVLQTKTLLNDLYGGSINEISHTMIIPGGLNVWEKLYHASTGKYPASVTSRWFEKGRGENIIQNGDYEVKIGSHIPGDPDYELHPVEIESLDNLELSNDNISLDDNETFLDKLNDLIN